MPITEQIIKDCIAGNKLQQKQLFQQTAPVLLGICYRFTKSLDDAEDILQEAFIKIFTYLPQYKFEGSFEGWMKRIVVNTAITYIKKHKRYKKELDIEAIALHPISNDEPNITIEVKELVEIIRSLPVAQQTVFNLVAVEGYNQVEVSDMLQMNVNTVRSHYNRARMQLIKQIEQQQMLQHNTHAK
jgi:RNA polymerase sigma factor (sigma-70 family)